MDRLFILEFGAEGIAIETTEAQFYASWLGVGLIILSVVSYKIIQHYRKAK